MRRAITGGAILGAIALIAAGCAPDAPHGNAAAASTGDELLVTMDEFSFAPARMSAAEGATFTITLENNGSVPHEFMVGRDVMADGGFEEDLLGELYLSIEGDGYMSTLPDEKSEGEEEHDEDEGSGDEPEQDHAGNTIMVEPGGRVQVTLEMPSGGADVLEMACFIEGHYEAGMHAELVVNSSSL
jgi:uncharacterized cupredoxin-like copper-binding protein